MERKLYLEREMACDEGVVRVTHAPRAYAACLASLAERGLQHRAEALSLGAWQRRSELVHRVHGILLRKQTLRPVASAALLGTLGCGLVAGSVELVRCRQLVAFVPSQKAETVAAVAKQEVIPVSAQGDAVFTDKRYLAPGYHAVKAKALMPAAQPARRAAFNAQPKGSVSNRASEQAGRVDLPVVAKADKPNVLKTDESQQQWIVFTSVDEVGAAPLGTHLTTDFDPRLSGDTAIDNPTNNDGSQDQVRSQITITRLILRILPPSQLSSRPEAGSYRNGWFVIQL
jgi:hypothetical protein